MACIVLAVSGPAAAANSDNGDAKRGAEIYTRCEACHALNYNRTGPKHCGVVTVPGFNYSPAMRHSKLKWDERTLDRFLADPPKVVPGTTMTYAGIANARERADLIAYLRDAGRSKACK